MYAPSSYINYKADKKVKRLQAQESTQAPLPGETKLLRALRIKPSTRAKMAGRLAAGTAGALTGGALVTGPLYAALATPAAGILDSVSTRRVEKMAKGAAVPEGLEALAKAGVGQKTIAAARAMASRFARAPAAPKTVAENLVDRVVGPKLLSRKAAAATVVGGALAGGALASGAGWAAATGLPRVYYRDEDGQFTSKDRAVVTGAAGAVGALAGALAARRGVAAIARQAKDRVVGRLGRPATKASGAPEIEEHAFDLLTNLDRRSALGRKKKPEVGSAEANQLASTLADANEERTNLADTFARAAAARLKGSSTTLAEKVEVRHATRALVAAYGSKQYKAARQAAITRVTKEMDATVGVAKQGVEFWGNHQLDLVERKQINSLIGAKVGAKGSWWEGVRDATQVKEAFKTTLKSTGSLDQAMSKLPKDKRADIEAIRNTVAAERADFAGRVTGVRKQRDDLINDAKKTKATLDRAETRLAAAEEKLTGLRAVKPKEQDAEAIKTALKSVDDIQQKLSGLKQAHKEASESAAKAEAFKLDGEDASKTLGMLASPKVRDSLRPRDPFSPGKLLPELPMMSKLEKDRKEAIAAALAPLHKKIADEAIQTGAATGKLIEDALAEANRRFETVPGRVSQAIEALASRVAPYQAELNRNLKILGGSTSAYLKREYGQGAAGLMAHADAVKEKTRKFIMGTKTVGPDGEETRNGAIFQTAPAFLWRNKGKIAAAGVATGALDLANDGSINANWSRIREIKDDPLAAAKKLKATPFFRPFVVNGDVENPVIVTGLTYKGKDGKALFLSGRIEDKDGKVTQIAPGVSVEDAIRRFNGGQGGQGGQNGQPGQGLRSLLDQSVSEKIRGVVGMLRGKGLVEQSDVGGQSMTFSKGGNGLSGEDLNRYNQAVGDLRNKLSTAAGKAGDFFPALQHLMGRDGHILTASQKRDVLLGGNALFGQAGKDLLSNKPASADQLEERISAMIDAAPKPADENQARLLRQAVRIVGTRASQDVKMSDFSALDGKINDRMAKSAGSAPKLEPAPMSSPNPSAQQQRTQERAPSPQPEQKKGRKDWSDDDYETAVVKQGSQKLMSAWITVEREAKTQAERNLAASLKRLQGRVDQTAPLMYRNFLAVARKNNDENYSEAEIRRLAAQETIRNLTANVPYDIGDTGFDKPIQKSIMSVLRKAAETTAPPAGGSAAMSPAERRRFDETKISRHQKGDERGGEFAPRGAAKGGSDRGERRQSDPPPQDGRMRAPPPPGEGGRSYFEPVRLGGTVGGALGGSAGYELFNRYAPTTMRGGKVSRFIAGIMASTVAGLAGNAAGEAVGAQAYRQRGQLAPPSYDPPPRPAEEEIGRSAGGVLGSFAGAAVKRTVPGIAVGAVGTLAGEELFGAAARVARERFGLAL
jgi:hypothetical protein